MPDSTRARGPAWRRPRARLAAGLLAVGLLSACSVAGQRPVAQVSDDGSALNGTDISDVVQRPALTLTDTAGRPFDLRAQPADALTVLYFGYTRCPDLCPTTMADLAAAKRAMTAADRGHVQVVFVTEDPGTDTAPVIRRWLDAFDTSFVGLVGGDPQTEQALDVLKAPRTVIEPTAPEGVIAPRTGSTVQHVSSVYVFHGTTSVVYTDRTSPADYAADFSALLAG